MADSIMPTERECYITGATNGLHIHHIYLGNPGRRLSEEYGCWVWLHYLWHNGASYGVHGRDGHALDLKLKQECQEKFEALHGREEFMRIFGRNYL